MPQVEEEKEQKETEDNTHNVSLNNNNNAAHTERSAKTVAAAWALAFVITKTHRARL